MVAGRCGEKICGCINPKFILPKVLNFFVFAALACVFPFISVFYASKGYTGNQIGVFNSILKFVGFVAGPIWTAIADKSQKHKLLLILSAIGVTITFDVIGLIPFVHNHFWMLIIVVTFLAIIIAPLCSLIDETVVRILDDQKELYGQQRLWGALSWGCTAFIVGLLIDHYGIESAFYGISIGMFMLIITACAIPPRKPLKESGPKTNFWTSLSILLNRRTLCFMVSVMIWGLGFAVVEGFLFLFLLEYLQASKTLMGLSITITVLMELPFFFFGKPMLSFFKVRGMVLISHAAYIIRVLSYTFVKVAWWILPIEILHGISFSCMWSAIVQYASDSAPKGLEATSQGLFGAAVSLGQGLGAVIGGFVYHYYGPVILFRSLAITVALSGIFFLITFREISHDTKYSLLSGSDSVHEDMESLTFEQDDIIDQNNPLSDYD